MAERITKIKRMQKSEEQIKQESLAEVTDAIAANKDSIMKAINIISTLDDAKILDAVSGMVNSRGVIANKFAVELNKEHLRKITNAIAKNKDSNMKSNKIIRKVDDAKNLDAGTGMVNS